MKQTKLCLAMAFAMAITFQVEADNYSISGTQVANNVTTKNNSNNDNNYPVERTIVEVNDTTTTDLYGNEPGEQKITYVIDGIEMSLTKEEKIKSKNWNLEEEDYARYLYIMKYTPRGLWSPEIDPPIALGNEANTEESRSYYAEIMNSLEWERRQHEGRFQISGIHDLDARLYALGYVRQRDKAKIKKGEFSKTLQGRKLVLRSLFVDMENCKKDCQLWVTKQVMQVSKKVQLDIYIANGKDHTDGDLYRLFTIPTDKITNGDINISRSTDMVEAYKKGWSTPFIIQRDDNETKRKGMYGAPDNKLSTANANAIANANANANANTAKSKNNIKTNKG